MPTRKRRQPWRGLLVMIILRSGLLQVTSTDPSEVLNRTTRTSLVSTMLRGAPPIDSATPAIVARHSSNDMFLEVDVTAERSSLPPSAPTA